MTDSAAIAEKIAIEERDDEPPGTCTALTKTGAEEPPGRAAVSDKRRFFDQVPDECWNYWKWQYRNRVT
jgi:hypothetical protein